MNFKLLSKKRETKEAKTFIFEPESPIAWIAGQYLIYSLSHENPDTRGKMRFFTISSPPFLKNPTITTRIAKDSSSLKKSLDNLKMGDIIQAKGPDGDFIIDKKEKKYIFIAGGIGITPFRSILKQLEFENKDLDILLLYSSKNNDIVFKKELDDLRLKNLKIIYFVKKRINKNDIEKITDYKKRIFFISGPDPMVDAMEELLLELSVKKENIKGDYFSGYSKI